MDKLTESKFEEFYLEQMPRVYNFFRYRFVDDMLAEDLTAQTFEKAWKHRKRYQHRLGAFSTWILTIAHRIAIDTYRKKQTDVPMEEMVDLASSELVENEILHKDQRMRMQNLLGLLPERERACIAMKYGAGLSNREIAKICKLSESNVGVILHRTVQSLREKWEKIDD